MKKKSKQKNMVTKILKFIKIASIVIFVITAGATIHHQYITINMPLYVELPEKEACILIMEQNTEVAPMQPDTAKKENNQASLLPDTDDEPVYDSISLLERCVEAEAGNQPLEGRRMVVDVILNRVDDEEFPDTVYDVITQPQHFSSYWDGGMDKVDNISELTRAAVEMELKERSWTELYYFTAERYSEYGTPWNQVGDHYFSTK